MVRPIRNKKEPLLVNTIPEGNNGMSSRAIFFQRKLYDKEAFSSPRVARTKPIDIWYERLFYGRLNPALKPVHLSEVNLKPIPNEREQSLYALNFVVDAFMDLKKYVSSIARKGLLSLDEPDPYTEVIPVRGWSSLHKMYGSAMEINYATFLKFAESVPKDRLDKVKTFGNYIPLFVEYINTTIDSLPFTRTKFATTRFNGPTSSGLMIEISRDLHSDDDKKYQKYILSDNFAFFKKAAQNHGFMLDKNAPWRLVADIESPAMKKYMEAYGIKSTTDFFNKYYYLTHTFEIDSLKVYISQFYNSMVANKPNINLINIKTCANRPSVSTKIQKRLLIDQETLNRKYDNRFWLRMYTFIRAREMNKSWPKEKYEVIVKKALDFEKGVDIGFALDYIERQVRDKEESRRPNRSFQFRSY